MRRLVAVASLLLLLVLPAGAGRSRDRLITPLSIGQGRLAETATADCANYIAGATHTKGQWIREFFTTLKPRPAVRAFYWFNVDKEADWRLASCPRPAALNANKHGVSSSRFLSRASN